MDSVSQNNQEENNLLSVSEFAAAIGKTERQVYRYINQARIKTVSPEVSGRMGVRIPESEIGSFKDSIMSGSKVFPKIRTRFPRREDELDSEEDMDSFDLDLQDELDDADELEDEAEEPASDNVKVGKVIIDDNDERERSCGKSISIPLERHEAVVMQFGYLQSKLEHVQHLLSSGTEKDKEKDKKIESLESELEEAKKEIIRLNVKVEVANDNKKESEHCADELRRQLDAARNELERIKSSLWGKMFFN